MGKMTPTMDQHDWHGFFHFFSPMPGNHDHPPTLRRSGYPCVEIRIWGIYFRHKHQELLTTLWAYDLANTQPNPVDGKDLTLHFLAFDWERSVRELLLRHSVPFELVKTYDSNDASYPTTKKKVYLVENDLNALFSMNVMLENAGYDVLLSHSAMPLMEETLPPTDLFILDKGMPDGDTLQLYRKLRSRAATRNIPVILLSTHEEVDAAIVEELTGFLEKPFEMDDLLRLVSRYTMNEQAG